MPGTVIRNYREYNNLSQKYVAEKMGISQNAYSKIENNQTQLTVHHVKQLAVIFKVPVTDLLKDEFEFIKPIAAKLEVDKAQVTEKLERIQGQLKSKVSPYDQGYMIIFSLIKAAEDIALGIV